MSSKTVVDVNINKKKNDVEKIVDYLGVTKLQPKWKDNEIIGYILIISTGDRTSRENYDDLLENRKWIEDHIEYYEVSDCYADHDTIVIEIMKKEP